MNKTLLIKKYFEEHSLIESDIKSFNKFIDFELQKIVDEIGDIVPTIIPPDVQEFKIKFDKIWIEKPQIIEADGSKKKIYPIEARLRKLTYSAPIFLEVKVYMDGTLRESFTNQIGKIPIMLKSKYCHLFGLNNEELIAKGEDPDDHGGYFILNGNERVIITVEDLLPNRVFIQKNGSGAALATAKVFSQSGLYSIPQTVELMKDGTISISFGRFKKIPIIPIIKALGLTKDQDIMRMVCGENEYDEVYLNLYNSAELKEQEEAMNFVAKKLGALQPKEEKAQKTVDQLDKYLLPHIGINSRLRMLKAYNLCKIVKKLLQTNKGEVEETDKDHYKNKKLKLSGDLLADLFRVNMKLLVNDVLYNFQRLVKRSKFQSVRIIIRDKLLTSRIQTAMATGVWVGGRVGISQNIDRVNFLSTTSHLQRVVSLLSSSQENFEARALHPTHWGKLCPIETPEGTPIGLRKNLSMLAQVTQEEPAEEKIKKLLENCGMKLE